MAVPPLAGELIHVGEKLLLGLEIGRLENASDLFGEFLR